MSEDEAIATVGAGEQFPARHGRIGFRRNFVYATEWRGRRYSTKQVEVYAVEESDSLLVLTVIAKYF